MARKQRVLGNDTYFTVFNSDLRLIKDPVKKILFGKIKNWIYRNEDKSSGKHFQQGHFWTFAPYKYWAEECGLQEKTVGKHLRELVESGMLIVGNFNHYKQDKTFWYRLPNDEELKKVNFQMLYYGETKGKKGEYHTNEYLLEWYKNGMLVVENRDKHEEKLGSTLPEYKTEYITENTSEYKTEIKTENTSEYKTEDNLLNNSNEINNPFNQNILDYNILINDNNINNHINHLSKLNIEDISIDIIYSFFNKFHNRNIDDVNSEEKAFMFKSYFDGLYQEKLDQKDLDFCKLMFKKYFDLIISPQLAEQTSNEVTSTIPPSPPIPLTPSSPNIEENIFL